MMGLITGRRFTVLDLFSAAAGGWSLGLHRAGFVTVAACEIVEWRRFLYLENFPHVRLYSDVRTLTSARLVSDLGYLPDIIVGSPPCQDISSANTKGQGIDGERSGLYLEAVRLVGDCRPRWFAFENSSNLRTRGADRLLGELEALGYACEPCVVGADNVGANHVRKRSWLIGFDPIQLADAAEIGRGSRRPGRCAQPASGPRQPPCRHDADPGEAERRSQVERAGDRDGQAVERREGADRHAEPAAPRGGNPSHPDEARQPHGRLEPGLRPQEIPDDGRGDGRRDDGSRAGQMGGSAGAGGDAEEPWADWNGGLARHLRLDDGLSAWVAGTRIALGSRKGTPAASLIVEAFGDAVVPQIPEVIGRAILRTEAALEMVLAAFPPGIIRHGHDEPDEEPESRASGDGDAP
ncbi:DNA cytosine methyltransferase [Mesorhizobium sp. PUT5]|uniref:DNA cytosine methyltransferase n=1 Tax=Mesorhizobium sp. PUT5 TaxID=3454629 RepID=UPI003FA480B9